MLLHCIASFSTCFRNSNRLYLYLLLEKVDAPARDSFSRSVDSMCIFTIPSHFPGVSKGEEVCEGFQGYEDLHLLDVCLSMAKDPSPN